jgi:fructose/tagatose bisphosphate aldolase
MDFEKVKTACKNKTLLGVGPVSKATIDAAIEICNENPDIFVQLIPSRRQIETKALGGGYVGNTEWFAKYVREKNTANNIILARDHGGPYQASVYLLDEQSEIEEALESYQTDIKAGFDVLHIDPSLNPYINNDFNKLVEQIEYFINELNRFSDSNFLQRPYYEVGTDGHGTKPSNLDDMKRLVDYLSHHKEIKFLVANIGTCVKERCNIGKIHVNETLEFVKLCNENGLNLKCHNSDYLFPSDLRHLMKLGVHSANIAPEYGVMATDWLLENLLIYGRDNEYEKFINLAVNSKKWQKWMINEHPDKRYLATICGHYVLEKPQAKELKYHASKYAPFEMDRYEKEAVKTRLKIHLEALGWL